MADMPHDTGRRLLPPLEPGDRLDQKTFHERYESMPKNFRAELIGGLVFVPSPLRRPHGSMHKRIIHWLCEYEDATPGTESFDNATAILSADAEVQPDGCLVITATGKGQTRVENEYTVGPPELMAEISYSSEAVDLHLKKADYERSGVREYIVVVLRQKKVVWWTRRNDRFEELPVRPDGILRSELFPGLWLDPIALFNEDHKRIREVLQQGLASPEHQKFVAWLAQA